MFPGLTIAYWATLHGLVTVVAADEHHRDGHTRVVLCDHLACAATEAPPDRCDCVDAVHLDADECAEPRGPAGPGRSGAGAQARSSPHRHRTWGHSGPGLRHFLHPPGAAHRASLGALQPGAHHCSLHCGLFHVRRIGIASAQLRHAAALPDRGRHGRCRRHRTAAIFASRRSLSRRQARRGHHHDLARRSLGRTRRRGDRRMDGTTCRMAHLVHRTRHSRLRGGSHGAERSTRAASRRVRFPLPARPCDSCLPSDRCGMCCSARHFQRLP